MMSHPLVAVDHKRCTACGVCGRICPRRVLVTSAEGGDKETAVSAERAELCMGCGQCAAVCPADALTISGLDMDGFAEIQPHGVDPGALMGLLSSRRSVRRYRDGPVPRETLERIVEAAALAPVAAGGTTNGVIVIETTDKLARLTALAYDLYGGLDKALGNPIARFFVKRRVGKEKLATLERFVLPGFRWYKRWYEAGQSDELRRDAPAAMLFTSPVDEPSGGENCTIAAYHAALMAHALGLGGCLNGLLPPACNKSAEARELIGLAPDREVHLSLTLGYPKYRYRRTVPRAFASVEYV